MGSPSRNVQYHPPRLSEDRLNLPQPHSPSLPTHCTAPGNRQCARQRCPHLREHPRVYGVGLGPLSHRLRKTPRLQGIGSRQRQPRLQERLLEGAVPRSGGLVHDRANRLVDPRDQRVESRRVIGESRGLAGGSHVGVEMRLRNVNAYYGRIWHLFLLLCLFSSPHARVSIQAVGKDGGDQTPFRPLFGPAARGPTTATPGAPNRGAPGGGPSEVGPRR